MLLFPGRRLSALGARYEPCRDESLDHLAERPDVELPARVPQADIGLITLRLEVVDDERRERTVDLGNRWSSWSSSW
jgi:hypothetical protein